MSISICLLGTDGLLLAADSRLSLISEDRKSTHTENNSQKLFRITDNMGIVSIGTHEDYRKYVLGKIIEHYENTKEIATVEKVVEIMKSDYLLRVSGFNDSTMRRVSFQMVSIIAGYNGNKPYIISCDSGADYGLLPFALGKRPFRCIHGMDTIADYWIKKLNIDVKLEEGVSITYLKKLATLLIVESASFMDSIGLPIQMATISKKKGFQFIGKSEIDSLIIGLEHKVAKMEL